MNHIGIQRKSIEYLFRSNRGINYSSQRSNHSVNAIKLFKDEPIYGASMVMPDSPRQSPFKFIMKYVNIGRYYANYDKKFNAEEFLAGSRYVFFKLSDILRRKALDELESFIPDNFSAKLRSAITGLADSDRTYLLDFEEKHLVNDRVFECDFQKDSSNQREFVHMVVCYDMMLNQQVASPFAALGRIISKQRAQNQQHGAAKNVFQTSTMEDVYRAQAEFTKNFIAASFIYSKQVRPTLDEDWTLSNANYARVKA